MKKILTQISTTIIAIALILTQVLVITPVFAEEGSSIWNGITITPVTPSENVYSISNSEELAWIAQEVNNGTDFSGKTINLTNDIVLNENAESYKDWETTPPANEWTAIGSSLYYFKGTFDGKGHTVSGIYINKAGSNQGLFGGSEGTIKNVSITNSFIKGTCEVGAIAGHATDSTIDNCSNASIVIGEELVAGIVGQNDCTTIKNCYNEGKVISKIKGAGISGYSSANSIIDNCVNNGTIATIGSYPSIHAGIVAYNEGSSIVKNSYNNGDVLGRDTIGGIVGENATSTVENCYNTGAVKGSASNLGGIVGINHTTTSIVKNCHNEGAITESDDGWGTTGGIVGYNSEAQILNCHNNGVINGTENVGGVVGETRESTVKNCYNAGTVSGIYYVGGVVGLNDEHSTVINCYNINLISGNEDCIGGIAGDNESGTIENCYNTGSINATHETIGGIVGCNYDIIKNTYYYGCKKGIGVDENSQTEPTPFVKIQDNEIDAGKTTSIIEQITEDINTAWSNGLGTNFAISYTNYNSDVASISGTTVTGITNSTGNVTGTMTIKQNELTATGFTGETKTINVGLSMPLTVNGTLTPPTPTPTPDPTPEPKPDKTLEIIETPTGIKNPEKISVKPVGEAFDQSVEVRLKDDPAVKEIIENSLDEVVEETKNVTVFPLDISLYIKGTDTKVQPNEGTSVDITCPIPENLLNDKENVKVVCVIDGKLQILKTKIVSINDVHCVRFTANHFSPYAIVVDKDNTLSAINNDTDKEISKSEEEETTATNPKTGDNLPIPSVALVAIISGTMLTVANKKCKLK